MNMEGRRNDNDKSRSYTQEGQNVNGSGKRNDLPVRVIKRASRFTRKTMYE